MIVEDAKRTVAIGQSFGRLTVIGAPFLLPVGNKGMRHQCAVAECECGNVVTVLCNNVKRGLTSSCGCLSRQVHANRMMALARTHGGSRTSLYFVWQSMHARCENANHKFYYRYGGRGIAVCEGWLSFEPFRDWALGNGYRSGLTIDRKNNSSGYSPENCEWITKAENTAKMHRDKVA